MTVIRKLSAFLLMFFFISCGGLQFSQQSLNDTQQISEAAIDLLNKSDNNYSQYSNEAEALKQRVQEIYSREQLRKMNKATVSMWGEVINGEGNLFSLLQLWKNNGTLSNAMRMEAVKRIERLLNSIHDLELHKKN